MEVLEEASQLFPYLIYSITLLRGQIEEVLNQCIRHYVTFIPIISFTEILSLIKLIN